MAAPPPDHGTALTWRGPLVTTLTGVVTGVGLLIGGYYGSDGATLWTIATFTVLGTLVASLFLTAGLRADASGAAWIRTVAWLSVAIAMVVVPLLLVLILMTSNWPSD